VSFDDAAVRAFIASAESVAAATGQFRRVNTHEPKSAPGSGLTCALWIQEISPFPPGSGLNSTSGYVVLYARIYGNMLTKPEDNLDPQLMSASTALLGAYSADYTLGGTVRNVDLLGEGGQQLRAQAGYETIGSTTYRIMTITLPCVINDAWTQVP
jgi:hypothetical protein